MTSYEFPHPKDKVGILRRIPVFASCTEKQLVLISERTRLVEYKKGEIVYRESDVADAFYIVVSGRVRVFARVGGREETLTVLHNGDSFGEISLLTGEAHSATVQVVNDALVLQLQKKDFEELINRIPSLVLYLSRLLSKRLRTKQTVGTYTEATIVALYSAVNGVGRTLLTNALAAMLHRETRRETVVINLSTREAEEEELYAAGEPAAAGLAGVPGLVSPEHLEQALRVHPLGFHVLAGQALLEDGEGGQVIAPLLSELTKRYAYILIDLPSTLNATVLKAFTQADQIYVVTDEDPEHLLKTKVLLPRMREQLPGQEQPVQVILNLMGESQTRVRLDELARRLDAPVGYVLPRVSPQGRRVTVEALRQLLAETTSPYTMTIRRLSRQLGGSIVGLALGSGAALGLAHIGVLKVLERERIPIDIVAGSSIGSLVAGLWAAGRTTAELEQMALKFKRPWEIRRLFLLDLGIPAFSVFVGVGAGIIVGLLGGFWAGLLFGFMVTVAVGVVLGPLTGGPIQGAELMKKLETDFQGKTFEDTWLPLKIVASNPVAREEIVFESGSIAEAVRASVSIPGIFKPVQRLGKICLDGGVLNPIPVNILRRSGAHRVIAVNVFPVTAELLASRKEADRQRLERDARMASRSFVIRLLWWLRQEFVRSVSPLIFDVIMRSMQAMEYSIAEVACHDADLILRPSVPGSHWLEFYSPEKFIQRGEEVAMEHLAEIKRIAGVVEPSVDKP